jgi:uncharacterized membrane protein YdbT with pleckstrin-like domain
MTALPKTDKVIAKWRNIRLQPDEMVIREYKPGLGLWHLIFFILSVVTFGLFLLIWLYVVWANSQTRWAVTNKRVLERSGVFSKRSVIIDRDKITDIEVRRPLLAQVFHNGKVFMNTAG